MKLTERLNILIQATSLSQKSGNLTLDDAVKAKSAIDIISTGKLNQNFTSAIKVLIDIIISSQKKGVYSLKDAYMIYLSIDGIEMEIQNEVNKINGNITQQEQVINKNTKNESVITIPPKILKRN
jgi:hypothetical protein